MKKTRLTQTLPLLLQTGPEAGQDGRVPVLRLPGAGLQPVPQLQVAHCAVAKGHFRPAPPPLLPRHPLDTLQSLQAWLPDGYRQILKWYVFGPSGLNENDSATLRCKIGSLPFLGLRPHALHPGTIQGKEGIQFFHLATLCRKENYNANLDSDTEDPYGYGYVSDTEEPLEDSEDEFGNVSAKCLKCGFLNKVSNRWDKLECQNCSRHTDDQDLSMFVLY